MTSWIFLVFSLILMPDTTLGIMNKQLRVGTSLNCDTVDYNTVFPKAMLRHNLLGCLFLRILNFVYKINVTYVFLEPQEIDEIGAQTLLGNGTIDIYARPVALRLDTVGQVYPVHALFVWRVGFLLRREHKQRMLRMFFSKPFNNTVWSCLYAMTFIAATIFFILSRWERRLGNEGECSFVFELLLTIGGFCQHIFPVETTSVPRRTAHFVFFLFTYVIYTFYTSNLLSHLVIDKEDNFDLEELSQSDYNYMYLDDIKDYQKRLSNNSSIFEHIRDFQVVNISTGLEAVRSNKTALLSDFVMVNRDLAKRFNYKEICDIFEIDLFSKLPKYLVVSKDFRFKEEIKISALRMQEAGLIQRLVSVTIASPVDCSLAAEVTTSIQQISGLLAVLFGCYILTGVMLVFEKIHYCRNRVWPYVE
ncbi:uncharacterized protein LOC128674383 [Plodia interpunctella]|uniref:uncharacterized protein LOC128674383 n=1 Tax=Plodia interpunctella TaxID=58824 RepID=UPI0023684D65|nr:uncharacterized protein LOC128674383 [Plodia interpunctella]